MSLNFNATFAALADPARRAIFGRLASGEATVSEWAEPFAMNGPGISKHLNVLEKAGVISRGHQAQWRRCRLKAATLKAAADWLKEYLRFRQESFDRLGNYLQELETRVKRDSRMKEKKHGAHK